MDVRLVCCWGVWLWLCFGQLSIEPVPVVGMGQLGLLAFAPRVVVSVVGWERGGRCAMEGSVWVGVPFGP